MCISSIVCRRTCSLGVFHLPPALSTFLHPLPQISLNREERGLMRASHFEPSVPRSLTFCTLSSGGSVPNYCGEKFLWWWLSKTLMCEYSRIVLGVIWLLSSFNKTMLFCVLLGTWPIKFQILRHWSSARDELNLIEWNLSLIIDHLVSPQLLCWYYTACKSPL